MQQKHNYEIFTLSNGLRCVWQRSAGLVSYIGIAVNVGSRDERKSREGLAHFVEHTLFKGTRHRKAWHISCRMERVGGELNAYTSKEETMIYTSAPSGNSKRALELISDIVKNSVFPAEELDKEREVVTEEIYSYRDSPMDAVYDDFEERIYKGSDLAHNILGSEQSVAGLSSADCRRLLDDFYTPDNMVLYIVDSSDLTSARRMAKMYFDDMSFKCAGHNRTMPELISPFSETVKKGNHQANTIVGARVFGRNDSRRHALFLLNNYLGGPGMNSRLNRELRERRGWVYTVDSTISLMSDAGIMQIYYGCEADKVSRCEKIIKRELQQLASSCVSSKQLDAIKNQYCGQMVLTSDHKESRAMSLAKSLMYFGEIRSIEDAIENIKNVTAEDMRQVAELICASGLSRLTIE